MCLYTFWNFIARLYQKCLFVLISYERNNLKGFSLRNVCFARLARLARLGDNMVDFKKMLQESKDRKFSALASKRQTEPNPYSCNYSPVSGHKYCEHEHCILDATWLRKDAETTKLRNKLQEEKDYLKNGEGTYGYDKVKVYKNVLKIKKLLGERR